MRVFVTGGTGLVGSLLVKKLRERGDQVVALSRRPDAAKQLWGDAVTVIVGDPVQPGPWMEAVSDCDAVVHLAGEGIFNRRWSQEFKDLIYSSRIKSTDNIVAALGKESRVRRDAPYGGAPGSPASSPLAPPEGLGAKARVLVNGSAIGYYGPHGGEELTENSLAGNDFLAKVCLDWEKAAQAAIVHGIRVVLLRTGVVLDQNAGALAKMLTPFKMCVGGPIAGGTQHMSWIHNEDEVGLILFALDHPEVDGPINATAPNPVTNKEFSKALGKVLGRPSFLPTPGFALRVLLGESSQIITQGQRVLPRKALSAGYAFKFSDVEAALRDLLA
jgi:NAD dependent epimerase/dehydratase family enzyme